MKQWIIIIMLFNALIFSCGKINEKRIDFKKKDSSVLHDNKNVKVSLSLKSSEHEPIREKKVKYYLWENPYVIGLSCYVTHNIYDGFFIDSISINDNTTNHEILRKDIKKLLYFHNFDNKTDYINENDLFSLNIDVSTVEAVKIKMDYYLIKNKKGKKYYYSYEEVLEKQVTKKTYSKIGDIIQSF